MTRRRTRSSSASPRKSGGKSRRGFSWRKLILRTGLFGALAGVLLLAWFVWDMPGIADVKPLEVKHSITVLANNDAVIARYGGIKGDVVSIADLPPYVVSAVIAIEDRRFYDHFGIDLIGLARAMFVNAREGGWVQGGSTITQQLAKNLFLTPDKTIRRKVQEALLAVWIDWEYTKDDILSAYLNRVYFGAGAYGIDAAAHVYFDKSARELTLWESAVMAGLLKAPSRYSPSANPERSAERGKTVIAAMKEAGYIDEKASLKELKNVRVKVAGTETGDLNRYFADWVIDEIDSYVANAEGDIVVRTTFDPDFQLAAEEKLKAMLDGMKDEAKPQAAVVTLSEDGAVLAMIGGTDYAQSQYNRAVQAQRQPGSSFKPFVFLAALEAGYGPQTLVEDAPIRTGKYRPDNHDGEYYGQVQLVDALALSLNTATVRLLADVGMPRLMDVLRRMNFESKFRPELATGLGAGESTLLEMTSAYAIIANGGYPVWPYAVLSIETDKGKKIYKRQKASQGRVFAEKDIANLDQMMVQVVARGTGQAAQLSRGHVAGKTGTSQNYRDAWFIGYSDNIVTGVWMGNDDSSPMKRVSGGGRPARLWHDYMNEAIGLRLPDFTTSFPRPSAGFLSAFSSYDGVVGEGGPPQPAPADGGNEGGGFSSMLRYWSTTDNGGGNVTPDNKPVYNQ